jgi:hypothetical protein
MTDKKSCDACNGLQKCFGGYLPGNQTIKEKINCPKWKRNPRAWLSILPTEPGLYFYSKNLKKGWSVGEIMLDEHGDMVWVANNRRVKFNGQWQGPISPEGI